MTAFAGRYTLLQKFASGGMAEVFLAPRTLERALRKP